MLSKFQWVIKANLGFTFHLVYICDILVLLQYYDLSRHSRISIPMSNSSDPLRLWILNDTIADLKCRTFVSLQHMIDPTCWKFGPCTCILKIWQHSFEISTVSAVISWQISRSRCELMLTQTHRKTISNFNF